MGFSVKSSDTSIVNSKSAFVYKPYICNGKIRSMRVHINNAKKGGTVTLTIYREGKSVGSITLTISDNN